MGLACSLLWFPVCGLCPRRRIQGNGLHPHLWVSPRPTRTEQEHTLSASANEASSTPLLYPWALPSWPHAADPYAASGRGTPPTGPGLGIAEPISAVYLLILLYPAVKDRMSASFKDEEDFPGGAVVKNPPANAGDTGSSPGPGRSHMPQSNSAHAPQLLSLRATTTEAWATRAHAPQQEKPLR